MTNEDAASKQNIQRHFERDLTPPSIVAVYMKRRAELQRAGAPRAGWTVGISSRDTTKLKAWAHVMDQSAADIGLVSHTLPVRYGATWVEDPDVSEGDVRITIAATTNDDRGAEGC